MPGGLGLVDGVSITVTGYKLQGFGFRVWGCMDFLRVCDKGVYEGFYNS